tara:strand:- start:2304 stop:5273 length:2970 start_codon:yes stop_codon:yes gene_type:complete
MSQNTNYNLQNQSGANFRAELNNNLLDIVSNNSGANEPATMFAYELWVDETNSVMKIRNSGNSAWITLPFSITVDNSVDINAGTINGITSLSFGSGSTVTTILDEDTLNSNSNAALATQQSIKAYVDAQVDTVDTLSEILAIGNTTGGNAIQASTTDKILFRDSAIYINSGLDGTLNLVADTEIQLSTPYIDLAAASVSMDGNLNVTGIIEFDGISGTGSVTVTDILDEDNMASNSATKLATQQSIKAYVDAKATAQDLDITDGSTVGSIDLDSEVLGLIGGTGIGSVLSGNNFTFSIGQAVETSSNVVFNQVTAALVGNADTATLLQNARTIAGVSFNGSANVVLTTENITENSSFLYYTDARFDTRLASKTTANLTEGSNLYYTDARWDTRLASKTTDNITEGSTNLFYTNERADDRVAALIQNGTGLTWTYNDAAGTFTGVVSLSPFNTSQLSENTNLYYTDVRVASKIDSYVNKAYIDALNIIAASTSGNSATATTLATQRAFSLSGDVVASAVNFNGAGDVVLAATIADNSVSLGVKTSGDYVKTITGTASKIEVSGSGTESREVVLTLPNDVSIANDLTVAGDLTVNGDLTYLNTTNLKIEDNLFELNANLTGTPVNDSGMLIQRGNQNNSIFMWDESADKFTLGLTTAAGTGTGNISLSALGTLVANIEGQIIGNVTGQVSTLSNHDTDDLSEGSTNLYHTTARSRSAISASGDITYNSSTGVISFSQAASSVTSVNSQTGAVVLTSANIAENTNLYYTDARARASISEGSTQLAYNSTTGVLTYTQGNTDGVAEGSNNLYYTDSRVVAKINSSVDKTFIDNLNVVAASASGNAATATTLEAARTIAMTGDVVWTSAAFNGSGNVTGSSVIQEDAVEQSMIADDAVGADQLASNSVVTLSIADDQVTQAKVAANAIGIPELNVSDGTNGQALTTNGSGTLAFANVAVSQTLNVVGRAASIAITITSGVLAVIGRSGTINVGV